MDSPFSTPGSSKMPPGASFGTPESQSSKQPREKAMAPFKRPPSPSLLKSLNKRKAKVLDEAEYVEKVEKIIERDFFPELERIRARQEYIEASERNDSAAMRRLRERYTAGSIPDGAAAGLKRPFTPDTFDTPQEDSRQNEVGEAKDKDPVKRTVEDDARSVVSSSASAKEEKKQSLDQFLARHTSEDNESYHEIQEEQFRQFRVDKAWMFKDEEALSIETKKEELVLPSIEGQAKKSIEDEQYKIKTLEGWTYKNVNQVFYNPDGVEFNEQELLERKRKEREIILENTRFRTNPWKIQLQKDGLERSVHNKMEKDSQKVGADGKALSERPSTPAVNGFKFLRMTPSPMLASGEESPLMTWGEVDSTPYRLEGCETPLPMNTSGGPSFSIQGVPKRDRIAYELAEKNSKFYRDKKGKAIKNARLNIKTPKGTLTERMAGMSPAAQRLASGKLGIRLGTDKALRSSYTPSPARMGSLRKDRTPTPSSSTRKVAGTPKSVPPSPKEDTSSLTDNLLNLPFSSKSASSTSTSSKGMSSRSKASEFL
jgi:protein DGCR14